MKNINEILAQTDEIAIIEDIGTIIWSKKEETDDFTELSEAQRNFVYIDIFEGALHEGGFDYFFSHETGNFAREIVAAYKAINAPKTANIVAKAIGSFGLNNYDDSLETRLKAIEKLDEKATDGWDDLEEIFFDEEQEEDIVTLIVDYVKANKEQF